MIKKIIGRGFKGLDFTEEIDRYNVLVGPNGAGKSARTQALTIGILGYLPSDGFKQPGAILANHGHSEMKVGFQTNGDRFVRHFQRGKDGGVSQHVTLNGKKLSQKEVERKLIELGNPRIFDLRAFNEMSEAKKIEFILEIFPPTGDLKKLDRELAKIEEREKFVRSEITGRKQIIEQLSKERSEFELPSGSLPEIQRQIKEKETEVSDLQNQIVQIEMDEARAKAKEEGKEEARNESGSSSQEPPKQNGEIPFGERPRYVSPDGKDVTVHVNRLREAVKDKQDLRREFVQSLNRIRQTMIKAGCDACAALIVINAETKRWKGGDEHGSQDSER